MKTFILSDESVNSYGFVVKTEGISLERMEKNPVMLYNHDRKMLPIGKWVNFRKENGQLLADADFDPNDALAKQVEEKIKGGYLCSASISFNVQDGMYVGEYFAVTQAELYEASIVAVPSNQNARVVSLSADNLERINTLRKTLSTPNPMNDKEKETLQAQVAQLQTQKQELSAEVERLGKELKTERERSVREKVQAALAAGVLTKEEEQSYVELGLKDSKMLETVLLKLSAVAGKSGNTQSSTQSSTQSITAALNAATQGASATGVEDRKAWSWEDWQAKDPKGLELMAKEDAGRFEALYKQRYSS